MPAEQLRNAYEVMLTMAATLLSFGGALFIEHAAGLHADVLVLAVVLALALARTQRTADLRRRLAALGLVPAVAAAATLLGRLMARHPVYGAAVFTVLVAVPLWIRRFGPRATQAGTLATLPLVALLIVPRPALPPAAQGVLAGWWWSMVIGLMASGAVWLVQGVADLLAPAPSAAVAVQVRRRSRLRPRPSTRMAVQMGLAVAVAFVVGDLAFGRHWPWVVLTAFLVGSGNRGRADVLRKGVARWAGACAGTVLAAALAPLPLDGAARVVVIFVVLAVALWLRPRGYGYWAAGMTAALALLYGCFDHDALLLLPVRLGAIAVGAVLAVAAAWWVLPVTGARRPGRRRPDRALPATFGRLGPRSGQRA